MRILLFGAGGMLASALSNVFRGERLTPVGFDECDITQPAMVQRCVADAKPDVIINAAAFTDVDQCEEQADKAMAVNGTAVGTIAQAAKSVRAIVVHFSTDYVFEGKNSDGYTEDAQTSPLSAYGRSKERGEQLLLASGVDGYLVRTSWLYGPGGRNFVDTMLRLADEKSSLKIVNDQVGSPTYTHDLAAAVRDLVTERPTFGIYHRTNDGAVSWFGFAQEIFRRAGKNVTVEPVTSAEFPRPAARPAVSILRTTKLPGLRPWPDALADYLTSRL